MTHLLLQLSPALSLLGFLITFIFGPMIRKPWLMVYGAALSVAGLALLVIGFGLRDGWL